MRTSGWFRRVGALCLLPSALALAGCYTGLSESRDSTGADGADDGVDGGSSGADGGDTGTGLCGDPQVGETALRRLTATQYDNTVRDLLGIGGDPAADFSADERVGPFRSNVAAPIGDLQAEQYMSAAEDVAAQAVADLGSLLPCDPTVVGEDACAQQFIAEFAPRAYRRPLLTGEAERLQTVYADGKAQADFTNGIRVLVQGILQSPYFLYHTEFGATDGSDGSIVELTDHEIAARLSYFLWDTMPDDELFAAAEAGELGTEDGLAAQIDRMLDDPKARDAVASFHLQWLGVDEIQKVEKNPDYFPSYTPELAEAMKAETAAFTTWVVLEGDAKLATLLTADFTVTEDPALLALYGASLPGDHVAGDPVPLPADQRSGLLTQAAVMTRHAHVDQTSPVHRGKVVRENVLCQILAPPPPDVNNTPPSPDPDATTRERFEMHRADPTCSACHNLIDGIGFGFEHYDGIGTWRSVENGQPVDATGWIVATDFDGDYDGAIELSMNLAGSEQVAQCVARQWFRFAFGRAETDDDTCTTDALDTTFTESGQDIKALIKQLVLSDAFRFRRAEAVSAIEPGEEEVR